MSTPFQIVVCGTLVPDPLQTLEPVVAPAGPSLKNEMMLPAILDPWASHALVRGGPPGSTKTPGTKVWLVSLGPKAKLQQVMMTVAQKVPFELVALDGPASGFTDSFETAAALAGAIEAIPGLDRARLLLFGGWESASPRRRVHAPNGRRAAGHRGAVSGRRPHRRSRTMAASRSWSASRAAGTRSRVCAGPPAVLGWATGHLPEPRNNPQVGMANMRAIMPALQRAKPAPIASAGLSFASVDAAPPAARNAHCEESAGGRNCPRNRGLDGGGITVEPILLLAHVEADGALGQPALEALSAAARARRRIDRRAGRRRCSIAPPSRSPAPARRAFWRLPGEAFTQPRYATDAAAAEALCRAAGARSCWRPPPRAGRARCPEWPSGWAAASILTLPASPSATACPASRAGSTASAWKPF